MILLIVLELYWTISDILWFSKLWFSSENEILFERFFFFSFLSFLSSPLHLLFSHFLHLFFQSFFCQSISMFSKFHYTDQLSKILRSYVLISLFQLSLYWVFCVIPSHHIDNEIFMYIIKSCFHLWLFIIDWSKHPILFLRYLITFHQTIVLKVVNEIIWW